MRYLILFFALLGIVDSGLALRAHYDTGVEPCDINAHWDCGVVNHSSFAVLDGIPVADLGIAGYLVMGVLAFARQRFALFLVASGGLLFAFRLSMIEQYGLGVWCLYCVISQCLVALIVLLSLGWFAAEYFSLKRAARPV